MKNDQKQAVIQSPSMKMHRSMADIVVVCVLLSRLKFKAFHWQDEPMKSYNGIETEATKRQKHEDC